MKRFLVFAMILGVVSVARAEMPGASQPGSGSSASPSSDFSSSDSEISRYKTRVMSARTPQEFLSAMPSLPTDVCGAGNKGKGIYHANMQDFGMALTAEIRRLNQEAKKIVKEKEPEIQKNMMAKSGISEEDAKKMKSKKMSREEKQAMADKYMQQTTGISLQEARDLKKKDKGDRKEWAQAYGTKQMATGAYNSPEAKAEQQHSLELVKKSEEVTRQVEKITAREAKMRVRVEEFEKREIPRAEAMYEAEISPLLKQMAKPCGGSIYIEAEVKECERLTKLLRPAQDRYCAQFGPAYRDALRNVKENLESLMADYSLMDKLQDEQMRLSTGIDQTPVLPGHTALLGIQKQTDLLDTVYKYNLRNDR